MWLNNENYPIFIQPLESRLYDFMTSIQAFTLVTTEVSKKLNHNTHKPLTMISISSLRILSEF